MSLIVQSPVPPNATCAYGGTEIESGVDGNGDSQLQSTEVASISYVCNGAPGDAGATGPQGPAGPEGPAGSQIRITAEPPGDNCRAGGQRIEVGAPVDGGLSVSQTAYICNGTPDTAPGSDGGAGAGGASGQGGAAGAAGAAGEAGGPPPIDAGPATCGNGAIEAGEQCDDGNLFNLDGCDSSCRYEMAVRLTSLSLAGSAPPASLGCVVAANRLGTAAIVGTALGQLNSTLTSAIASGTINVIIQILGLADLTGTSSSDLSLALFSATVDARRGPWPGNNPIDWWFLGDSGLSPSGLPTNILPGNLAAGVIKAGPGAAVLPISFGGGSALLEMTNAKIAATISATPAPNSPGPPPGALASGLLAFQNLTSSSTMGLCGGVTVDSLAQIPVPSFFALGGSGNCAQTYTACPAGIAGPACNSFLDVLVNGCTFATLQIHLINPTQPDISATGGGAPRTLTVGPGNKVPASQTTGNLDAYSSFWQLTANRAHLTGRTCTSTADCQALGMTCNASGICN